MTLPAACELGRNKLCGDVNHQARALEDEAREFVAPARAGLTEPNVDNWQSYACNNPMADK